MNMRKKYAPRMARITEVREEAPGIKSLRLALRDKAPLSFNPGQFIEVTAFGIGEAPLSICSSSTEGRHFEICIRNVGNVTAALSRMGKGDSVGVRGPYGNGYPIEEVKARDIIVVGGGIGFPPLASVLDYIVERREDYGKVTLLYGARNPDEIILKQKMKNWKRSGVDIFITVDEGDKKWKGDVGLVTTLFDKYDVKGDVGISCGPPVMMKFVVQSFKKLGINDQDIHVSLERLMQCGIGKCGHCNIGSKYVCIDGPIFSYDEIKGITEKVW